MATTPPRLLSLDVFRGATVALMILVNNPGSWNHLYAPLAHAPWHGLTPTDLVFPWFLFAVGNALALVLPRLQAPAAFWPKVARRTLLIFLIGLALNAAPLVRWGAGGELVMRSWEQLRWMGVLQRIALAFGAAAVIVHLLRREPRAVLIAVAVLLLGYWGACLAFGAAGDPYSLAGWFGTAIDRDVLGASHLYRGEGVPFDPEGLASTVPAVAQVLLGWWVGEQVREALGTQATLAARTALVARLFIVATGLLVLAYAWQLAMPLNKKIWTSSYVLFTTGAAMAALALLIHTLELHPARARVPRWARLFEAFGQNALFVFVLSGLVPRFLALARWRVGAAADGTPQFTSPQPWLHEHVATPLAGSVSSDPRLASLLFALANVAAYGALAAWMARRRLFIRV